MLHRRARALEVLLLATLPCGCQHPLPPALRLYPPPTAAQLLARLDAQTSHIGTLRSDAKVEYRGGPGEHVKVSMTFLVQAPDRLRIEAGSTLAGAVASLASDGRRFQLLDLRHERFLAGPASACNIARLLRIELLPADVVTVVGGSVPRIADVTSMEVGWDGSDGGREVLTLRGAAGEVEAVRFDTHERRWDVVRGELWSAGGKLAWRIDHGDYEDAAGAVRLPRRTDVSQPGRKAEARVRYRSRERGVEAEASLFHLDAPSGVPVEDADCDARAF